MTQTLLLLGNQSIILPLLLLLLFWQHERKFYPKEKNKNETIFFSFGRVPCFKKKKKSRDLRRRLYVRQKVVELKRIKNNKITKKNREKILLLLLVFLDIIKARRLCACSTWLRLFFQFFSDILFSLEMGGKTD